jgi:hypothetical protein
VFPVGKSGFPVWYSFHEGFWLQRGRKNIFEILHRPVTGNGIAPNYPADRREILTEG